MVRRVKVNRPKPGKRRSRGQALVEMALVGLVLAMLLAAAIDFGRAYYTAIIVQNMAGEGASYGALYPEYDQVNQSCSIVSPVPLNLSIQERARRVGRDRGLVIKRQNQDAAIISVVPASCQQRCTGDQITVQVTYRITDLFLPGLLGISSIPITRSASQTIQRDAALANCR
jgi:Flp pilus assembly protein TadG